MQAYEKAVEYNPADAMLWYALGDVYSRLDNSEASYNAYSMSDTLSPWYYSDYEGVGVHMYTYKEHELINIRLSHEADNGEGE